MAGSALDQLLAGLPGPADAGEGHSTRSDPGGPQNSSTPIAGALPRQPGVRVGLPAVDDATAEEGDVEYWAVTTIIGALEKRGIAYWTAEQAALAALHQQATWHGMLADDDPACEHADAASCPVVKWLRDAAYRRPKGQRSATELGQDIHAACEAYALTGTRPEVDAEVRPYLDRFDAWLQRFTPTYQATEVAVYHPELGYAGTADAFLTIDGVRFIADYKTTRNVRDSRGQPSKPYPETVALQLAAYRHATFAAAWRPRRHEKFRRRYYLLSPAERGLAVPLPEVDTGLVIHITPEACDAYPIRCDEPVLEAYLAVQDAARWLFQDSGRAMTDPLLPAA